MSLDTFCRDVADAIALLDAPTLDYAACCKILVDVAGDLASSAACRQAFIASSLLACIDRLSIAVDKDSLNSREQSLSIGAIIARVVKNACVGEPENQRVCATSTLPKTLVRAIALATSETPQSQLQTLMQAMNNMMAGNAEVTMALIPLLLADARVVRNMWTSGQSVAQTSLRWMANSIALLPDILSSTDKRLDIVMEMLHTFSTSEMNDDAATDMLGQMICSWEKASQLLPIYQHLFKSNIDHAVKSCQLLLNLLQIHIKSHEAGQEMLLDPALLQYLATDYTSSATFFTKRLTLSNETDIEGKLDPSTFRSLLNVFLSLTQERIAIDTINSTLVSCGVLRTTIDLLSALCVAQPRRTLHSPINDGIDINVNENNSTVYTLRRDLLMLLSNMAYHNATVQDLIREQSGILLILSQCKHDSNHPFLREYAMLTLRNVLTDNVLNQRTVEDLRPQEIEAHSQALLTQQGIHAAVDKASGKVKLNRTLHD